MESGNYCLKYINDIESFGFNRNKKIDLNSLIYKDIMRRRYMESKYGSYNNNNKVLFEKYKSFEKNKLGIETNFKRVIKKKYIIKYDDDEYPQNKTYFREKSQEKGEEKTHKVVNNLKINKKGKDSFSKLIESIKIKLEKIKKMEIEKKIILTIIAIVLIVKIIAKLILIIIVIFVVMIKLILFLFQLLVKIIIMFLIERKTFLIKEI